MMRPGQPNRDLAGQLTPGPALPSSTPSPPGALVGPAGGPADSLTRSVPLLGWPGQAEVSIAVARPPVSMGGGSPGWPDSPGWPGQSVELESDSENGSLSEWLAGRSSIPNFFKNFREMAPENRYKYVENMMRLKGLTSNSFLIDYFISSILNNTSCSKIDVDNFLNTNLNTILNDQRNNQLNTHSFTRYTPFLLNNSCESEFSKPVPYKPDNAFNFELQDELEQMNEAHKIKEYGITNKDSKER